MSCCLPWTPALQLKIGLSLAVRSLRNPPCVTEIVRLWLGKKGCEFVTFYVLTPSLPWMRFGV